MPQAVNLTLKNGAATPVNKTFTLLAPAAGYAGIAEWALKEGVSPNVFPRITAMARQGNTPNGVKATNKVIQIKVRTPVYYTDPATSMPQIVDYGEVMVSVKLPDSMPTAARADLAAYTSSLLGDSMVKAMFEDGAPAT